jgi:hypothetical protein
MTSHDQSRSREADLCGVARASLEYYKRNERRNALLTSQIDSFRCFINTE